MKRRRLTSRASSSIILMLLVLAVIQQAKGQMLTRIPPIYSSFDTLAATVSFAGDFKNVLASKNGNTISQGSLAVSFEKTNPVFSGFEVSAQVSLAGSNDTLSLDYGHALLIPKSGLASGAINAKVYVFKNDFFQAFLHGYFFINTTTWSFRNPDTSKEQPIFVNGEISGLGILVGVSITKREQNQKDKDAAGLAMETGISRRIVSGDLVANADLRTSALRTDARVFYCWEFGISTSYRSVTAALTYYQFLGSADIPGFSGGQLVAGVSFLLDFVSF